MSMLDCGNYLERETDMAVEQPSKELVERFEQDLDASSCILIEFFAWMGLPEKEQLSDLQVELSDAISGVLKDWL